PAGLCQHSLSLLGVWLAYWTLLDSPFIQITFRLERQRKDCSARSPQHHATHSGSRLVEVSAPYPGALIEFAPTSTTPKAPLTQCGPFSAFLRVSRRTRWAPHLLCPPRDPGLLSATRRSTLG